MRVIKIKGIQVKSQVSGFWDQLVNIMPELSSIAQKLWGKEFKDMSDTEKAVFCLTQNKGYDPTTKQCTIGPPGGIPTDSKVYVCPANQFPCPELGRCATKEECDAVKKKEFPTWAWFAIGGGILALVLVLVLPRKQLPAPAY